MKRLTIVLVAAAIALTSLHRATSAEEAGGIPDEIVKELDSLVGTWETEGKIGNKRQTGEFTLRWERTAEKKKICLSGKFLFVVDGNESRGVTLIGWNAGKQCIEDRGFDANGGNDVLYWKVKSPTLWKGELVSVADGETVTAKADLIRKSDTEFVMEAEYDNGDISRSVMRKAERERKKKAKK